MTKPHPSTRAPVTFRTLTEADIPFGLHLRAQAGWNQTEADWRRLLALAPEGCFLAEVDGQPAGTAVAVAFGPVIWISMVLVDEAQRGRGVGTAIMRHVLEYLDAQPDVASVRLDATDLGEPIYRKLGFTAQFPLARFRRDASTAPDAPPKPVLNAVQVRIITPADLDSLIALDHHATHTDRRTLLPRLLDEQPQWAWLAHRNDEPLGYLLMRPGINAVQIGPATTVDHDAALALLSTSFEHLGDQSAFIDVPLANTAIVDHLATLGFTEQRRFTRMTRGATLHEHVPHLLASSGPEKG